MLCQHSKLEVTSWIIIILMAIFTINVKPLWRESTKAIALLMWCDGGRRWLALITWLLQSQVLRANQHRPLSHHIDCGDNNVITFTNSCHRGLCIDCEYGRNTGWVGLIHVDTHHYPWDHLLYSMKGRRRYSIGIDFSLDYNYKMDNQFSAMPLDRHCGAQEGKRKETYHSLGTKDSKWQIYFQR